MTKQEEIREGLEDLFSDCQKAQQEHIANAILSYLHSQGVAIVETGVMGDLSGCCITRLEPLIEEKE